MCNSIKTFDFSTLYTNIPKLKQKEKLKALAQVIFRLSLSQEDRADRSWVFIVVSAAYSLLFCSSLSTIALEMSVPSQGHYGFHSFPDVD